MAVTDLASDVAATGAGYTSTAIDYGVASTNRPRFERRYEKQIARLGGTGPKLADVERVSGFSSVDQATADAAALANLNAVRRHRYSGAPGRPSGSPDSLDIYGNALTVDTN